MHKVITIDDEPLIKKTLRKLIDATDRFETVGEASDGLEALDLIERHRPDLIITDIRMPVMDGLELLEQLDKRNRKPEVVIISGYDDFGYAQQAIRYGVADYVLKPVRPALIRETLDRIAARLDRNRRAAENCGRWIVLCKNEANAIADRIWLLDGQGVVDALKRFDEALRRIVSEEADVRTAYNELLLLISSDLRDKGSCLFERETAPPAPPDAKDMLNYAVGLVAAAMARIRQTRNWGTHNGIKRAVDYVNRHFTSDTLTMQEVAAHINMSPAYFSRAFKEEMGIAFVHYLTRLRIEKAKHMLENPDCKTTDIATAIGYADYPHFAKVFKKYCGITPTEYRKRLGVL
jgi:two-component system response regulator YesN